MSANRVCVRRQKRNAPMDNTIHISHTEVRNAFAAGVPLLEDDTYKIHAGRREAGGLAEVHANETDIFHMLEGSATIVTGGTVVNSRTVAPGEVRGDGIEDGEARVLNAGDVIIIPNGTPHWFKSVEAGPVLYFVVKVVR